jgi:hypothetical protein
MYKVISKTHIKQMPEMQEPDEETFYVNHSMGEHDDIEFDSEGYNEAVKEYEAHLASLPEILRGDNGQWKEGQLLNDDEVEIVDCELCGGDGKETCSNPDHGFIEAMPGDVGRLGCPVCGHDPKHKVKNGGDCDECGCTGKVAIPKAKPIETLFKEAMEKEFQVSDVGASKKDYENSERRHGAEWAFNFLLNNKMIK